MKILKNLLIVLFLFFSIANSNAQSAANYENEINKYIKEAEITSDDSEKSFYYNKIAFIYWINLEEHQEAINYFKKSLEYNKSVDNLNGVYNIYTNMATIYFEKGNYELSVKYHKESLVTRKKTNDKSIVFDGAYNIAVLYSQISRYEESNNTLNYCLSIAEELKNKKYIKSCYALLSKNYENMKESEKSLRYFNLYSALESNMMNEEMKKKEESAKKMVSKAIREKNTEEVKRKFVEKALQSTEEALLEQERITRERQLEIDLLNKQKQIDQLLIDQQKQKIEADKIIKSYLWTAVVASTLFILLLLRTIYVRKKYNSKMLELNNIISNKNIQLTKMKINFEKLSEQNKTK